tara:strand:+ start:4397 stop:4849 length:453 start_codon:yes stop_codon:yes gene_type:complete
MPRLKTPKNNYLKYYRVVRYFVKKKYNLSQADLEMLYFLHDEEYFSVGDFKKYNYLMSWDKNRFQRLRKEGWIEIFRKHSSRRKALYQLSYKAINVLRSVYNKLEGQVMPVSKEANPLFRSDITYKDNSYKQMIIEMNKFIKQAQHPFLG